MPIFYYVAMLVISAAITAMLTPKSKVQAPEAGKLDVPTAEEGKEIPVAFGTNIAKDGNVIWSGDASTTAITSSGGGKK